MTEHEIADHLTDEIPDLVYKGKPVSLGKLLTLAAGAVLLLNLDDDEELEDPGEPASVPNGKALPAIVIGKESDPLVKPWLEELDNFLASQGVNTYTNARELTRLPKAPGVYAIPPQEYWPNIVPTLKLWEDRIRIPVGAPMSLRAYRPPGYNEDVGGASNSAHLYFKAIDAAVYNLESGQKSAAATAAAEIYDSGIEAGIGIYGQPRPRTIHIDTGHGRRRWAQTKLW